MKTEKIYSKINDPKIHKNLADSPIWDEECYHPDEIINKAGLYQYTIKFDGLKPVQVTNVFKYKD